MKNWREITEKEGLEIWHQAFITQEELSMLEACQSAQDWREACDAIKKSRGGMYPDDWWDKVKLSGIMDRILARWGDDSEIKVSTHKNKKDATKHLDEDYGLFGEEFFKNN